MYQIDFFYFKKIIFEISTLKRSKTYKKNEFLAKKMNFLEIRVGPRFQTGYKSSINIFFLNTILIAIFYS
jgi:hypothetical protein